MEQDLFAIGAKVEHPQFGTGVITNANLTTLTVFFMNRGDKEIARSFQGFKLVEPSKATEQGSGGPAISLADLEKVFTSVLRRYVDFPETVEMGDRWKKGTLILKPGSAELKPKEIPIDNFFHKIVLVRDRLRVLEQRINSNEKLEDEEKVNLQQYITRIYGSMTTFNVLFKHKEQYFVGDRGTEE
ncbi:MAG: hypothetical protein V2I46_02990 [Bacteroides sp.]|jgi:hypothetical protein|nr:hypothetical protein [Bacteroides sp.]